MSAIFDWIADHKGRSWSLLVVASYFVFCLLAEGMELALRCLLFSVLPLSLIWFGNLWGGATGYFMSWHIVNQKTPGCFIVFIGWALLLLPILLAILEGMGVFN